jgi:hypothetical protein
MERKQAGRPGLALLQAAVQQLQLRQVKPNVGHLQDSRGREQALVTISEQCVESKQAGRPGLALLQAATQQLQLQQIKPNVGHLQDRREQALVTVSEQCVEGKQAGGASRQAGQI